MENGFKKHAEFLRSWTSQCRNQEPVRCSNRANTPSAETVEDYHRRKVTIPFIDHLINELEVQFGSGEQETAMQCLLAVPSILLA